MIRSPQTVAQHLGAIEDVMRRRGLSVTHQRLVIYRCLLEDDGHPDAERLFERVREIVPTISLGTVYKTLDTLRDLGAIVEVGSPRSATRYEAILEPHHHLICEQCGRIVDLYERKYTKLRPSPGAAAGFRVSSCTVQFRGRCRDCVAVRPRGRRTRRS